MTVGVSVGGKVLVGDGVSVGGCVAVITTGGRTVGEKAVADSTAVGEGASAAVVAGSAGAQLTRMTPQIPDATSQPVSLCIHWCFIEKIDQP